MYLQTFKNGSKREQIAARVRKYGKITHFRAKKITGWQDTSINSEMWQIAKIWGVSCKTKDSTYVFDI